MKTFTALATLMAAAAFAGCGDSDEPAGGGTTVAAGDPVSIDEALASDSNEPQLVSGNLLVQAGEAKLCSALAESFPPQCGGSSLLVTGLEIDGVEGLIVEGEVSWTDRPIGLLGVVSDGIITVSDNGEE